MSLWLRALKLASASFSIQVLTIIISPIVARIYGPAVIGEFSNLQSMALLLVPVVGLSLQYKLYSCQDNLERGVVSGVFAGFIARVFSLSVFLVCINAFLEIPLIPVVALVIAWSILIASYEFLVVSANVRKNFDLGIFAGVTLFLVASLSKLIGSLFSLDSYVLISAQFIGLLSAIFLVSMRLKIISGKSSPLVDAVKVVIHPDFSSLRHLKQFWWKKSSQLLLSKLGLVMPLLAITSQCGASYAGFYAISRALVMIPAGSIGKAGTDILSVYSRTESGVPINVMALTIRLFCAGIIPLFIACSFGGDLLAYILGESWNGIEWFVAPMSIWGFGVYLSGVSLASFNKEGQHQAILTIEQIHFLVRLALVASFLIEVIDLKGFVWGFAILGFTINLLIIWYVAKYAKYDS